MSTESSRGRAIKLTPAAGIKLRSVKWTWAERVPAGALTLIAGREGIGKSLTLVHLAAQLTRGTLPGVWFGRPAAVFYAAAEDSWSHTIGPRLVAAGADLSLVFRVEVEEDGHDAGLTLPADCEALAVEVRRHQAAMLAINPLTSVLDSTLDSHKDRSIRTALEPLAKLADATSCAVVGLVHHGKGSSTDPLSLVLGSRAFTAVARTVHAAMRDDDAEDGSCVLSLEKNNLGRLDVPGLRYVIESHELETEDGTTTTGRLSFLGETHRTVGSMLREGTDLDMRTERSEAVEWLVGYLIDHQGEARPSDVLKAARLDGHSESTVKRARSTAGVTSRRVPGFQAGTVWTLESSLHSVHSGQGSVPEPNGSNGDLNETEGSPDPPDIASDPGGTELPFSGMRAVLVPWQPQKRPVGLCVACGVQTFTVDEEQQPKHNNCRGLPARSA